MKYKYNCEICQEECESNWAHAKLCKKPECKKESIRRYHANRDRGERNVSTRQREKEAHAIEQETHRLNLKAVDIWHGANR